MIVHLINCPNLAMKLKSEYNTASITRIVSWDSEFYHTMEEFQNFLESSNTMGIPLVIIESGGHNPETNFVLNDWPHTELVSQEKAFDLITKMLHCPICGCPIDWDGDTCCMRHELGGDE